MLNNIIVDKLRIAIPTSDIIHEISERYKREKDDARYKMSPEETRKELNSLKDKIDALLERHLIKYAAATSYRHSYFRIEFNPTRYKSTDWNDDVNLQMIPEPIFLRIFQDIEKISSVVIEKSNVVELNLTKNLLLDEKVFNYTDMLLNLKTAHGIHPVSISSEGSKSVYFSSLKRDYRDSDYIGNRLIKFYDKTYELRYVKNKNLKKIRLREKLSDANKKRLGSRYSEQDKTVNLEGANLLRVELTYVHSKQMSKVAKSISDESEIKLSVPLLMEQLSGDQLYNNFDTFFEDELKKFIFHEEIIRDENIETVTETKAETKEQKYTQILPTLQLGRDFNLESAMYYFLNLLETAGLNPSTVRDKLKKINIGVVNDEFYDKLYRNLFHNDSIVPNEINLDLYQQIQRIDERNRADGRRTLSDEMNEDDELDDMLARIDE